MAIKRGKNSKRGKKSNKNYKSFSQRDRGNHHRFSKPLSDGFYPHGKPAWYSYTKDFVDVGYDYYGMAFAHTAYPGIRGDTYKGNTLNQALDNLDALIAGARAAESKFLADTGMDITNMNGKDIFFAINEILNSKQTFQRGLRYMKELATMDKTGKTNEDLAWQTYRDVTRNFSYYLNKAVAEKIKNYTDERLLYMKPKQVEDLINRIISAALIDAYTKTKDFIKKNGGIRGKFGKDDKRKTGETEIKAIDDMIDAIRSLRDRGVFGKYGYLFDLSIENRNSFIDRRDNSEVALKNTKYSGAKVESKYGANALELITSTVAAELSKTNIHLSNGDFTLDIEGHHTGQLNEMKADSLLFVGSASVNPEDFLQLIDKKTGSVRTQNIDALAKYLDSLDENVRHVIAVSDKNYSIKANFDGIDAQSKMNLKNVGEMLTRFGVGQVRELIDYLANCGPGMVQDQVNAEVRTVLQTQIAYYLFDNLHLEIKGAKPSVNVVNLMNISGMYMPLSVYLEGLRDSIKKISNMAPSSFVSVSISLGGPKHQRVWTAATWDRFREQHETQSFIEYTILKNLATFITNLAD